MGMHTDPKRSMMPRRHDPDTPIILSRPWSFPLPLLHNRNENGVPMTDPGTRHGSNRLGVQNQTFLAPFIRSMMKIGPPMMDVMTPTGIPVMEMVLARQSAPMRMRDPSAAEHGIR